MAPPLYGSPLRRLRPHAVGLAMVLCFAACSAAPRPNILVIVIESLRADRVGCYGTHRDLTPFLDSLAEHGNIFWNAYAQSSWALPSMASLWTSRYPWQHGVNALNSVLSDTEPGLAKVLKRHGYVTGGFSANSMLSASLGFAQGFDRYRTFAQPPKTSDALPKISGDRVSQEALAWLDSVRAKSAAPAFLYLHYTEPNFPYVPPKVFFDQILAKRPDPLAERRVVYDMFYIHRNRWRQTDGATVAVLRDMYDGEVMHIDSLLRQLFSDLKSRGFLEHSIVVITSDHGEAFLEHGSTFHGKTLYDELIHVPLLLLISGQSARVDIRQAVSLVDLGPTLLDLIGISAPRSFEGGSLAPFMGRGRPPGFFEKLTGSGHKAVPPVYSELLQAPEKKPTAVSVPLRSVIVGTSKLILHQDGTAEAYDLAADPGETNAGALTANDRSALQETIARLGHVSQLPTPPPTAAPNENPRT